MNIEHIRACAFRYLRDDDPAYTRYHMSRYTTKKRLTLTLDKNIVERLEETAKESFRTRTALMEKALCEELSIPLDQLARHQEEAK